MAIHTMEKGGIRQEVYSPIDVARLKTLGYVEVFPEKEVIETPPAEVVEDTPAVQNEQAIAEANKPIGSRKGKK